MRWGYESIFFYILVSLHVHAFWLDPLEVKEHVFYLKSVSSKLVLEDAKPPDEKIKKIQGILKICTEQSTVGLISFLENDYIPLLQKRALLQAAFHKAQKSFPKQKNKHLIEKARMAKKQALNRLNALDLPDSPKAAILSNPFYGLFKSLYDSGIFQKSVIVAQPEAHGVASSPNAAVLKKCPPTRKKTVPPKPTNPKPTKKGGVGVARGGKSRHTDNVHQFDKDKTLGHNFLRHKKEALGLIAAMRDLESPEQVITAESGVDRLSIVRNLQKDIAALHVLPTDEKSIQDSLAMWISGSQKVFDRILSDGYTSPQNKGPQGNNVIDILSLFYVFVNAFGMNDSMGPEDFSRNMRIQLARQYHDLDATRGYCASGREIRAMQALIMAVGTCQTM